MLVWPDPTPAGQHAATLLQCLEVRVGGHATGVARIADTHERTQQRHGVRGARERPLGPYSLLSGGYVGAFGALLLGARGRLPERFATGDLVLASVATHRLSRLISRDRVTRPLRAPFTEIEAEDPPLELRERARGRGLRRALGELLSCPYCLDQWIASAFVAGFVLAPRPTRTVASTFAVVSGADYLQHVQHWVRAHS